jgi:hypothetical protein
MKKLFVAGCSFSDHTRVDKVYGEFLAEKLGYEYVHEGAGCGSNWRIWRVITNHIMTGNLTPDDLLVVQYTGRERDEFWTSFPQPANSFRQHTIDHLTVIDKFKDGGHVIRFKSGSDQWQHNPEEGDFLRTYENHFISTQFEQERFRAHNFMFQHMLLARQIRTVFIRGVRLPKLKDDELLPEFLKCSWTMPPNIPEHNLAPDDIGHLSQLGHAVFAQLLYDHIGSVE